MSSYDDPHRWYEPTPHRADNKPPAPTLTEGARAPRVLYGPRGEVVLEIGAPKQVPFGFGGASR